MRTINPVSGAFFELSNNNLKKKIVAEMLQSSCHSASAADAAPIVLQKPSKRNNGIGIHGEQAVRLAPLSSVLASLPSAARPLLCTLPLVEPC